MTVGEDFVSCDDALIAFVLSPMHSKPSALLLGLVMNEETFRAGKHRSRLTRSFPKPSWVAALQASYRYRKAPKLPLGILPASSWNDTSDASNPTTDERES